MKKLLFIILLNSFTFCFSQKIFPGNDTSILRSAKLKVVPLNVQLQDFGYEGFYKDEKLKKNYACCASIKNSKYNELVNKEFDVIDIYPNNYAYSNDEFILKLYNDQIGFLYYNYNTNFEFKWNFEFINSDNLLKSFYCKNITTKYDKFTNDTTYTAPDVEGFTFFKKKSKGIEFISLYTHTFGHSLSVEAKGLILLFDNGLKIEKMDAEINVKVHVSDFISGYIYSIGVTLNDNDISLLKEHLITDSRLYIFDRTLSKENAEKIKVIIQCLTAI